MDNWKEKCIVPKCFADFCPREFRKKCSLRRIFLTEIAEQKKRFSRIKHLLSEKEAAEYKKQIYFWRKKMPPNPNKQKRNEKIIDQIEIYKRLGYKMKDAIRLVAEKYYLSPETVKDIVYKR